MTEAATGVATRTLEARYLGRVGYAEAVRLQTEARHRILNGHGDEKLLLLEHPSVYTLGRNADRGSLIATPEWLEARRVSVEETDRGGEITYHGPGQLVGYPILDLNPDRRDIRRYICDLQRILILTLADFNLDAEPGLPDRPAGVWIGPRKIASIGVHLRRWITTHGFALNVSTDLTYFDGIVPCGLSGVQMTSMEQLGEQATVEEVADRCSAHFAEVFDRRLDSVSAGIKT
jgi:lipoyl(octanoyl) transferase